MTRLVNQLTVLGSGASTGVPVLGCHCPICQDPTPSNTRLRSSVLLQTATGQSLLVDSGPDLRAQFLREGIASIDALILTHDHADHCHGIDDLRPLSLRSPNGIPVYAPASTAPHLKRKFSYLFGGHIAKLTLEEIPLASPTDSPITQAIGSDSLKFFLNPHGSIASMAIVHGKMAYVIDCHEIPGPQVDFLRQQELEWLLIDCTRVKPHPTHLNLEQALHYRQAIAPQRCGLTHLGHDFDHHELKGKLAQDFAGRVLPLCDGQVLSYSTA